MKLKKIITGIFALSMTCGVSTSALAAEQSPALNEAQELLFSCTEQILSVFAAITDAKSCAALDDNYEYNILAANGSCVVKVEGDQILTGEVTAASINGRQILTSSGQVEIDGTGTKFRNLEGEFIFSPFGEIMVHNSIFELKPGNKWEDYDEHVIKDYFAARVFDYKGKKPNGIRDKGLEAITKRDAITGVRFPRAKWREISQYREPNSVAGLHSITKRLVVVEPFFNDCRIRIRKAAVTDFGGGLFASGEIEVRD